MRMVVIALVLLSGFKVWTQDRMYRNVMGEALTEAYRDRALEVCHRLVVKRAGNAATIASALAWTSASETRVVVGNPDIDVALWDTNNPGWDKRYRHPNIVIAEAGAEHQRCSYDLTDGTAQLAAR